MKKILVLIWCIVAFTPLYAQEGITEEPVANKTDSLCINNSESVKEDINNQLLLTIDSLNREFTTFRHQYSRELRKKPKVIRDTIIVHSDAHIVSSIDSLANELNSLNKFNNSSMNCIKQSLTRTWDGILILIVSLFILLILSLVTLFIFFRRMSRINTSVNAVYCKLNEQDNVQNCEPDDRISYNNILCEIEGLKERLIAMCEIIDANKLGTIKEDGDEIAETVVKPSLESYNNSVYEFIKLNDHINSLRKKENKTLILALYKYLAKLENDKEKVLILIRECNLVEDEKVQFISLVDEIENFIGHQIPIINKWLRCEPGSEIRSYEDAVRIPIGRMFNADMDRDILGDDLSGQTITMVHKLGFYFPGNTIKSYREKSIVSA